MHLSIAQDALTHAEIAARLGVEEPTVVTLLHRLEREAWITRTSSPHDRRCKMVLLGRRAQRVIAQINGTADKLRHELLADTKDSDLKTCMRVLARVRQRAEESDSRESVTRQRLRRVFSETDGQTKRTHSIPRKKAASRRSGGFK